MLFSKWHSQSLNAAKIFWNEFTHLAKYVYNYIEILSALNCSKLTKKVAEDVINIVLVSLVLTLKQIKHSVLLLL